MVTWQEIAPNSYETKIDDIDIMISEAAYGTWTYLLSKDGRAIKGGNTRTLEEAQRAAEELTKRS